MKINCCICSRRTDTNTQRVRIGTSSVWPLVEQYGETIDLDVSQLSKDDYICKRCHSKVSHYQMSDRGPNKKIKICEPIVFETIITKDVLRRYAVPVMDTVSNTTMGNVVREELPISIESVSDTAVLDPAVSPMSEIENIDYLGDETVKTISNEDLNSSVSGNFQNSECVSQEIDSAAVRDLDISMSEEVRSYTYDLANLVEEELQTTLIEENSSDSVNSQSSVLMNQESRMTLAETFNSTSSLRIQGARSTQSRCFICQSATGRNVVPWSAIQQTWFDVQCYIPKSNRICEEHLTPSNTFNSEALQQIDISKQDVTVRSKDFILWLQKISDLPKPTSPYSFESDGIPAEKYKMFLGIRKENFDDLVQHLSGMRNTETRSVRDALAMFLLLLRNNMKQEIIAHNFSTSQQVVSKTIDTVSVMLHEIFVPQHLGYHHITREEAVQRHSIKLASNVLGQSESSLCLIADCTYNYIEKPSDFELQRKTFSAHKKRNLLKPLYIVCPNGYILEAAGPYFCDAKNNDAANIRHHYKNSDLLLFMEDDDFFIFDRGFRDVVEETTENGQKVFMPCLLGGKRTHFTCEEANTSRKVTMSRWVVESVNARVKNVFPWFKHMIEGTYVPKIMRFNRIACAILNKYFPPLTINKEFHELMANASLNQTVHINKLKEEIESLGIQRMSARWEKASEHTISDFPKLSMEDLKRITLGTYQIKTAEKYIEQHMKENADFVIFIHRQNENILRAKIQSRFSRAKTHNTWVKFDKELNGYEAIKGFYCTCKVGERTLGCCSHIATVVRYLGSDRHEAPAPILHPRTAWDAIDCNQERNNDSSGDEEDFL